VTYAPATIGANRTPQTAATAGQGAVAEFNTNGNFLRTVINFDQTGSHLAVPWGIALAPADFGPFSNDLLVGNFAYGNLSAVGGEIDAYNPVTGAFLGTLDSNAAWQGFGPSPSGAAAPVAAAPTSSTSPRVSTPRRTGCSPLSRSFRNPPAWLS
jgi:hypothetical protein